MARTLHCTLVEVPAMSDSLRAQGLRGFNDLVPWADPYIAALIEKLCREHDGGDDGCSAEPELGETPGFGSGPDYFEAPEFDAVDELPPPLDNGDPNRDAPWEPDWSPRNWPR